jgi:hypothetical protein
MKRSPLLRAREGEQKARAALADAHTVFALGLRAVSLPRAQAALDRAEKAAQFAGRALLEAKVRDAPKVREVVDRAGRWKRLTAMRLEWVERLVFERRLLQGWEDEEVEGASAVIHRRPGLRVELEGAAQGAAELAQPFDVVLAGLHHLRGRIRFTVVATESPELEAYADGKYEEEPASDHGRKTEAEIGFWKMVKKTGKFVPRWHDLRDHGAAFTLAWNRILSLRTKGDVDIDRVVCQVQVGAFPSRRRASETPEAVYKREQKRAKKRLKKIVRAAVKKKKQAAKAQKPKVVKRKKIVRKSGTPEHRKRQRKEYEKKQRAKSVRGKALAEKTKRLGWTETQKRKAVKRIVNRGKKGEKR